MKTIIRWSLWDRRGSMLGWTIGISAYIALTILVYGSIKEQAAAINEALNNLPPAARALFGSAGDFLSPIGYLVARLYYLILPLLFTMLAITLSNHLLNRDEQNGTLELLLARPVSRAKVLLAKLVSSCLIVLIVGIDALIVTIVCAQVVDYDIGVMRLVLATGMTLLLSLLFGAIAWALAGIGRFGRRAALGIACFVALGSYLLTSLSDLVSWLDWLAKLLPYNYYQPTAILEGTYNWWNAVGLALATLIIWSLAFWGFRRRDIG